MGHRIDSSGPLVAGVATVTWLQATVVFVQMLVLHMVQYGNKYLPSKRTRKECIAMFSMDDVIASSDNYEGFCVSCGESQGGCEPDAERYECESCGKHTVYGGDNIAIMFPHLITED
jgi:hypothetical protein